MTSTAPSSAHLCRLSDPHRDGHPALEILHIHSPSPLTPLGAKGLAEGNCMSVPACIANAIADRAGRQGRDAAGDAAPLHALMKERR